MNFLIVFFVAMLGIGGNPTKDQANELTDPQAIKSSELNYVEGDTFCDVEAHEKKLEAFRNGKSTMGFPVNASVASDTTPDLCEGSKEVSNH